MTTPLLATKLYIPPPRPNIVRRPRLIARLNAGLDRKLTLLSAPAGFGKTTLLSDWIAGCECQAAWLSLDKGDNDPTRFLAYVVVALQTIEASIGAGVLGALRSSQPPPVEAILTALLNDLTTLSDPFILVLDDYHVLDAQPVDEALTFLLEHLPPQIHLVIATREDPRLPLARLRAGGHLTELRAADLRFTPAEAAEFLNQAMDLNLSADDIAALETRTEGWIAGLQLAAISLQGSQDVTSFISSFTGSHHFVMDYLVEEVLQQQPENIQTFLLRTSILDRLCGPLCDAVLLDSAASGQATLEHLERANLFIMPLDGERRWYRYHHLFADLLRQRLLQGTASSSGDGGWNAAELHVRASQWYEDHDLDIEAFHHAAAANDIERAERLIEGKGMPLQFRGAIVPVLSWLASLPKPVLDARPLLWVMYASALSMTNYLSGIEDKLQAAEAALQGAEQDDKTRNLVGHIAAIRALLAADQNQMDVSIAQSQRALEYLHPNNLAVRTATTWKLGWAYYIQGDRAAARQALTEAVSISQATGNTIIYRSAATILGVVQETANELPLAAQTYERVLQVMGDPPHPLACEAYAGLARVLYEWNDLEAAERHGHRSVQLARQIENGDRYIAFEAFLARLKLARGDSTGATALFAQVSQSVRQRTVVTRMPEIAAIQVQALLHQGNLAAAAHLAQAHKLPMSQARVHLAQGDTSAALAVLETWRGQVEAKEWADERLKVLVLQALALQAQGARDKAVHVLLDALALAEPSGFIRTFVDEGAPMAHLISAAAAHGRKSEYITKLLVALDAKEQGSEGRSQKLPASSAQFLIEALSPREVEVLQLMAQGCSNQEIAGRLFLALDTVKWHNRHIFGKLQVQRRTEAVARAHELGLL
jgi:ATP/maltotriose-dependent transcriptional regulator MalT